MKNFSFDEFRKDWERIQKMGNLPQSALLPQVKKHDPSPSEISPPVGSGRVPWKGMRALVKTLFHRQKPPAPIFQPSDDLVRLLQVMAEEPRIYHLFMFLATSPLENRLALLQKLKSQIEADTHDRDFVFLIEQLQEPRIFEAAYHTIQRMRQEEK